MRGRTSLRAEDSRTNQERPRSIARHSTVGRPTSRYVVPWAALVPWERLLYEAVRLWL
jgi:hypothetical protein